MMNTLLVVLLGAPPVAVALMQSAAVYGTLIEESETVVFVNVAASCYSGMAGIVTANCYMSENDRVVSGWDYTRSEGYNQQVANSGSGQICLTCCSNLKTDVGDRVEETWDLSCDVSEDALAGLVHTFYGFEFRFARQRTEEDNAIVRCPVGRIGCDYEDPFGSTEHQGRSLTCTSDASDGDYGYCDATRESCKCNLPGSLLGGMGPDQDGLGARFEFNDGVRLKDNALSCRRGTQLGAEGRNWILKGYTLTLEVEELSNNAGEYWRSVTGCQVETEEVFELAVGETFYQTIKLVGPRKIKPYRWWKSEYGLPFVVCGIILLTFVAYYTLSRCRGATCPTCQKPLVLSRKQCVICRALAVPMPDPVLLARMQARAKMMRGVGTDEYNSRMAWWYLPKRRFWQTTAAITTACTKALTRLFTSTVWLSRAGASAFIDFLKRHFATTTEREAYTHHETAGEILAREEEEERVLKEKNRRRKPPPQPVLPLKIYVADSETRTENVFQEICRPTSEKEKDLVIKYTVVQKKQETKLASYYDGADRTEEPALLTIEDDVVVSPPLDVSKRRSILGFFSSSASPVIHVEPAPLPPPTALVVVEESLDDSSKSKRKNKRMSKRAQMNDIKQRLEAEQALAKQLAEDEEEERLAREKAEAEEARRNRPGFFASLFKSIFTRSPASSKTSPLEGEAVAAPAPASQQPPEAEAPAAEAPAPR